MCGSDSSCADPRRSLGLPGPWKCRGPGAERPNEGDRHWGLGEVGDRGDRGSRGDSWMVSCREWSPSSPASLKRLERRTTEN